MTESPTIHLIDTHCHLTNGRFDADRDAVIAALPENGVWRAITIGTGLEDARAARELVRRFPERLACAGGLDPYSCHEAGTAFEARLADLETLLRDGGFVALGEIGIEHHHRLNPHDVQIAQFEAQLALAARLDLPVVIHIRDPNNAVERTAHEDALTVLARNPASRGVIHSFSGDAALARRFLELGWHLSFNGMVTYKGNDALRAAAAMVPADRLLVETDAPYLPPVPHRGRRCEPAMTALAAAVIADVRGEREDDVRAWTTRNACRLFGLELPPEWLNAPQRAR